MVCKGFALEGCVAQLLEGIEGKTLAMLIVQVD